MQGYKTRLFLILWIPAIIGVLSFLLLDIHKLIAMLPLPPEETADLPPPLLLKAATVFQPSILVTLAVVVGLFLAEKVGLHAPAAEAIARREGFYAALRPQVLPGVIAGLLSGPAIAGIWLAFKPLMTPAFVERAEEFNKLMPVATRFLYGGITEEVLLRWGIMTFLVWLLWRVFQKGTGQPRAVFVIAAIMLSALLFAAGHLPIAFLLAEQPSAPLVAYVLAGNSLFGIVAGLLYWKKGLESAIIAHITTHAALITAITLGA